MPTYPYDTDTYIVLEFAIYEEDVAKKRNHGVKPQIITVQTTERILYEAVNTKWPAQQGGWQAGQRDRTNFFYQQGSQGIICFEVGNQPFGTRPDLTELHLSSPTFVGLHRIVLTGPTHYDIGFSQISTDGLGGFGSYGLIPPYHGTNPWPTQDVLIGFGPYVQTISGSGALAAPTLITGDYSDDLNSWMSSIINAISVVPVPFATRNTGVWLWFDSLEGGKFIPPGGIVGEGFLIWRVIHDSIVKASVTPPDQTIILDGGSVVIEATPNDNTSLTLFTVDGVDRLAENPYTKLNVHADVHVSAEANFSLVEIEAGSGDTVQLTCTDCAAVTWSVIGLPPGLSINPATGLISGTVPFSNPLIQYEVTVTATNAFGTVNRTFVIGITAPTILGNTWVSLALVGTGAAPAVTAILQTSTGRVIIGTENNPAIYKCDNITDAVPTFTDVAAALLITPNARGVQSIKQYGTRLVAICNTLFGPRPLVLISDDDGDTWSQTLANNAITAECWGSAALAANSIVTVGSTAVKMDILHSADNGSTWAHKYYSDAFVAGMQYGKRTIETNDSKILMSCVSAAAGSKLVKLNDVTMAQILAVATNNAICGSPDKDAGGNILMPFHDKLYNCGANGATATLQYTAAATIGTISYLASNVMVMCLNGILAVLRSTDNGVNWSATVGTPDGSLSYDSVMLSNGWVLLGTNGVANNLWVSKA